MKALVSSTTRARLYTVHSWAGVLFGLLLFVFCFSGVPALFHDELFQWERPQVRAPGAPISLDTLLRRELRPDVDHLFVLLPRADRPAWGIVQHPPEGGGLSLRTRDEYDLSGQKVAGPYYGVARFLRRLHTNLEIDGPAGRYTVGFGGVVLMVLLLTGVIIHARFLESLTSWRPGGSRHVRWLDAHNVLGVWMLPFHVVIAFSGAVLGLAGLFLSIIAFVVFEGDIGRAQDMLVGSHREASGEAATMQPLEAMIEDAARRVPGAIRYSWTFTHGVTGTPA